MVTGKGLLGYPSGEEGGEFTCKRTVVLEGNFK